MAYRYANELKIKSKLLFVIILSIFSKVALAQHISDTNFAAAIRSNCSSCIDGSNNLTAAAANLATLTIGGKGIFNLSGIESFTNLTTLDCSNNSISTATLGNLPHSLQGLNVSSNLGITSLPSFSSFTNLVYLFCTSCSLTSLPSMPNSLQRLDCYSNSITALPDLSNTQIALLICLHNNISSIPSGYLPNTLLTLEILNNLLTSIGSLPPNLTKLNVEGNVGLNSLPTLPNSLLDLYLDPTHIMSLPNCPPKLDIHNQNNGDARINLSPCNYSLPLTWLSFQTKVTGESNKKVQLNWSTVEEVNVKNFIVQRSSDGINYQVISDPIRAFNASSQNNYAYIDAQPIDGVSYYRVVETDFDGTMDFSLVRSVNNLIEKTDFSIFPNPSNGEVSIDLKSFQGKEVTISISDVSGKTLKMETINEVTSATYTLGLSNLLNGFYLVRIQTQGGELLPKKLQIMKQ